MSSKTYKKPVYAFCLTAMGIVLNIIGGQIALALKLPIYLDCIGTVMIGGILGPIWGMIPNFVSGIIMGFTVDIYSLYFAPVGIITGLMAGLVRKMYMKEIKSPSVKSTLAAILAAACISVPGTIVSSIINAVLFGGVTSSGSSILVQIFSHAGMNMTLSIFIVQFLTDYLDRLIAVLIVRRIGSVMPQDMWSI